MSSMERSEISPCDGEPQPGQPQPVDVAIQSFSQLFASAPLPIAVDTYQRGFVWGEDKILQLADDLLQYQELEGDKPPYYMGTVLVHRHADKGKRFIIDGQQRLTALCVLHQQLTGRLPDQCALTYSPASAANIRTAAQAFKRLSALPSEAIFARIVFTVITVERVDLAFTFFDSQNNRGVPLHATDLLKAYHLRAVVGATPTQGLALQTLCARRWEDMQLGAPVLSHDQGFVTNLFAKFLWRARYWTGGRASYGGHDALVTEFQLRTWEAAKGDAATVTLYQSQNNRLGTALTLASNGRSEIHGGRVSLSTQAEDLPFAIRQPIQKGVGFFLYAAKYAALLRRLVHEHTESVQVLRFREVHEQLLKANSLFLQEVFLLASLMYVDQFGEEKLWDFSLWLEHALGALRVSKQQVRYETAQNFIKQDPDNPDNLNLLDVIATSFRPEQVINHLRAHHLHSATYASQAFEAIEVGKGVQGAYKQAVLAYYGQTTQTSLGSKDQWITSKLERALP